MKIYPGINTEFVAASAAYFVIVLRKRLAALIDVARELLFSIQSFTIQLNSIKEFTNQ